MVQVLSGLFDTSPHGTQFLVNAEFPTVSLIHPSISFHTYNIAAMPCIRVNHLEDLPAVD